MVEYLKGSLGIAPDQLFSKALNDYLFNVEYGYAPEKKKDCNKNLLFGDKDWKDWETIRKKDNLVEMETLNKKYSKESLKKKLMDQMEKWDSWLPKKTTGGIIAYVAKEIDCHDILEKTVDIPYYCTNTNKNKDLVYTKIGTYTASQYFKVENKLSELLYVTQFEKKLYDLEKILREKLKWGEEKDYHYTTTLYFSYYKSTTGTEKYFFNEGLKRVYTFYVNRNERKWIDKDHSIRKKFYQDRADLGGWVPMARWKDTFRDDLDYWFNKIVDEIEKNTEGEHKQTIIKAFDDQLVAAEWKITFNGIKEGGKEYIKDELDKMEEISLEQRRIIYDLMKFDYKTVKIPSVSGKQKLKL